MSLHITRIPFTATASWDTNPKIYPFAIATIIGKIPKKIPSTIANALACKLLRNMKLINSTAVFPLINVSNSLMKLIISGLKKTGYANPMIKKRQKIMSEAMN